MKKPSKDTIIKLLTVAVIVLGAIVIAPHFLFNRRRGVRELPHERAARNFDDEIFARQTVLALAHAAFADFGDEARNVKLLDEIVEVVVGL